MNSKTVDASLRQGHHSFFFQVVLFVRIKATYLEIALQVFPSTLTCQPSSETSPLTPRNVHCCGDFGSQLERILGIARWLGRNQRGHLRKRRHLLKLVSRLVSGDILADFVYKR